MSTTDLGILPDERGLITRSLTAAAEGHDLILTSGGVSVGEEDHVKAAVEEVGRLTFWRLAIKPGRPVAMGSVAGTPFVGLPGNPVSALVSFEVFVRPALRRMLGALPIERPRVSAVATEPLRSPLGRRSFLRVRLEVRDDAYVATPVFGPGSHLIAGMARANALAVLLLGIHTARLPARAPERIDADAADSSVLV